MTFRINEEEYQELQSLAKSHGARCVGDFVRRWILDEMERAPVERLQQLDHLDKKAAQLELHLKELMKYLFTVSEPE